MSSVDFFDRQFERQTRAGDFALNPFEKRAAPFLQGKVLDMGCGLGNLSVEAARRGFSVVALDANAVARIRQVAGAEALPIRAESVDFNSYSLTETFDTIVAIGLFMFFSKKRALALLADLKAHVRPNGIAIVNVLIEGTTYLDMFEPAQFYLFGKDELDERFAGWRILDSHYDTFDASGGTVKEFHTITARSA